MGLQDYINYHNPSHEDLMDKVEQAETTSGSKPGWMSQEDYDEAIKIMPQERVDKVLSGFDPESVEPLYAQLYKQTHKVDQLPSEKQQRAARTISGIGDALKLITQGVGAGAGALISPDTNQGALTATGKEIQRLRDIYKVDRDKYNAGLMAANLQDINSARQQYNTDRSTLLNYLNQLRTQRAADAYRKQQLDFQQKKHEDDKAMAEKRLKQQESYQNRSLAIQQQRADNDKGGSTKSTKEDHRFVNPETGETYIISQQKFNDNLPQLYDMLYMDIIETDPALGKKLSNPKYRPTEKEKRTAVLRNIYRNPKALEYLSKISKDKIDGDTNDTDNITISDDIYNVIDSINKLDLSDNDKIRSIVKELNNRNVPMEDVKEIINLIGYK